MLVNLYAFGALVHLVHPYKTYLKNGTFLLLRDPGKLGELLKTKPAAAATNVSFDAIFIIICCTVYIHLHPKVATS